MPWPRAWNRKSDFSHFLKCLCSFPGVHISRKLTFQSSSWGVCAPLPVVRIFRNLTFQTSFWVSMSPCQGHVFSEIEALFEVSLLPCRGTHFQKSDFPNLLGCLWFPARGKHSQKSDFSKLFRRYLCFPAERTHFQKSEKGGGVY